MTSEAPIRAWRSDIFGIDANLNISPLGWDIRDIEAYDRDEAETAKATQERVRGAFRGFDALTSETHPGPVFSESTYDSAKPSPKSPPPVMWITFSAVNAECRALLEQFDLGQTDFHTITVLNAARTEPLWPEVFLMHVRNQKASIDIEACVAEGVVYKSEPPEAASALLKKHGLPPMVFYTLPAGQSITLERAALEGPDIWFEDKVGANNQDNLYNSDRLKCALEDAGMLAPWRVTEAPIQNI